MFMKYNKMFINVRTTCSMSFSAEYENLGTVLHLDKVGAFVAESFHQSRDCLRNHKLILFVHFN